MKKLKHYALIDTSIADNYHEDDYEVVNIYSNDNYFYVVDENNNLYGEYELQYINDENDSDIKTQYELLGKIVCLSNNYDNIQKKLESKQNEKQ